MTQKEVNNVVILADKLCEVFNIKPKNQLKVMLACLRHAEYLKENFGNINYAAIRQEVGLELANAL